MRIGWIGHCEIRIHWLFIVVMAASWFFHRLPQVALTFGVVLYHEIAHAFAATGCGFQVKQLVILPFGSVARIDRLFESKPSAEAFIALCGPLSNVLLVMVLLTIDHFFPFTFPWKNDLIEINLFIAAFNLVPGLPLDGGRVTRACFARFLGIQKATRLTAWLGSILGICLCGLGGWLFYASHNPSLLVVSAFLFLSASQERRTAPWLMLREITDKKGALMREESLPVRQIVARSDMAIGTLVCRFLPYRYHMVLVVDEACNPLGTLSETEVVAALMKIGSGTTLDELL